MLKWIKQKIKKELTKEQIKSILARVKYKNSVFVYHDNKLIMLSDCICVDTGKPDKLNSWKTKDQLDLTSEESFKRDIMALVIQQETHEAMEHFNFDGYKAFNPHNEYVNTSLTIHWNIK